MNARLALFAIALALCGGVAARTADAEKTAKRSGEEIYRQICQGCHMPDGRGAQGAGTYPALAENPKLASAHFTAGTVYHGRHNMPHFGPQPELGEFETFATVHLDDEDIASVVNFVRSHFGNHDTDALTAKDVAALHADSTVPTR